MLHFVKHESHFIFKPSQYLLGELSVISMTVIPVKTGIQISIICLDSRLRGSDSILRISNQLDTSRYNNELRTMDDEIERIKR